MIDLHVSGLLPFRLSIPNRDQTSRRVTVLQFLLLQTQRVSHPAREKQLFDFKEMAPGSHVRRGPSSSSEPDELANDLESSVFSDAVASTLGAFAPGVSAPAPDYLQRVTKLRMGAFIQGQASRLEPDQQGPRERPLKARLPDLYYGKSHMECYHFCQQCEDHFDTTGSTGPDQTSFAASLLRGRISLRWHLQQRVEGAAPLSWVEFKAFLKKNLGDSRAFVDAIWNKVKQDSQYQQEEVQDWASHLKHLQAILIEFDADGAPEESALIRFFREGLKPSVKAEMEQRVSWDEFVKKAIDAEAKASLQPPSTLREMDQRSPYGNRPTHTSAGKSQFLLPRDPCNGSFEVKVTTTQEPCNWPSDEVPTYDQPSHSPQSQSSHRYSSHLPSRSENISVETSDKKSRRKKKARYRKKQGHGRNSGTPVTGIETTSMSGGVSKDLSHITCFNCNEKGHYSYKCPEPKD